jgi:hypothetical protein
MELKGSLLLSLLLLLRSECTYTTPSGQYPYMGYGLGLWMSTDFLVKMVEPLAQQKWSSKVLNLLFLTF